MSSRPPAVSSLVGVAPPWVTQEAQRQPAPCVCSCLLHGGAGLHAAHLPLDQEPGPRPEEGALGPGRGRGASGTRPGAWSSGWPGVGRLRPAPLLSSCRSCCKQLPSMGSRIGLKSGKRCQVGAMPSAETGEWDSSGQRTACWGCFWVGHQTGRETGPGWPAGVGQGCGLGAWRTRMHLLRKRSLLKPDMCTGSTGRPSGSAGGSFPGLFLNSFIL